MTVDKLGTCTYIAEKDDPSNWHGEGPDDWVLKEDSWSCPHDILDHEDVNDPEYCVFHTDPESVPANINEGEWFVRAVNEESDSDDDEIAQRKKEFIGATFGEFEIEIGTMLDAGNEMSIRTDHATFREGITVDGVIVQKGSISFAGTEITGDVMFHSAEFTGNGPVSFRDAEFTGDQVSFHSAEFTVDGPVSFWNAEFTVDGPVWFTGAKFTGDGPVWFADAELTGKDRVTFLDAEFMGDGPVSFRDAEFTCDDRVSFRNTEFIGDGPVSFRDAEFTGDDRVTFLNTDFTGDGPVSLQDTKFTGNGDVIFTYSDFSGPVSFENTRFAVEGDKWLC